jgi:type VI secretion system secreted protein Hcp
MAEMFLMLDGIHGESLDAHHAGEIELTDWSWKLENTSSFVLTQGETSSKVVIQNIIVHKICDKASVNLLQYCTVGKHIPKGKITCRKKDGDDKVEYLKIDLTDIKISYVNWTGHGEQPTLAEEVELSFAEFKVHYTLQKDRGYAAGTTDFGWDILKHKVI